MGANTLQQAVDPTQHARAGSAAGVVLIIAGALEIVLGLIYLTNAESILEDLTRSGVTQAHVCAIGVTLLLLGLISPLLAWGFPLAGLLELAAIHLLFRDDAATRFFSPNI